MEKLGARIRALGMGTVIVAMCCGIALGGTPSVGAVPVANAGFGHAASSTVQIEPKTAGLSYAFTFGGTIADHTNNVARGQAQTANLGLIGNSLAAPACDGGPGYITTDELPKPIRVDSRDPGADTGTTQKIGASEQSAQATNRPFARGTTIIAPVDIEGAVTFLGGKNESTSGVNPDGKTIATAAADVTGINLGGGLVVLEGLHWLSVSTTDDSDKSSHFSIDSIKIAGQPAPTATLPAAIDLANLVLLPLGLNIHLPKLHTDNGTTFVDPLQVGVIPSKTRDQVAGTVFGAVQPLRQQIFQFLLDNSTCDTSPAPAILVADVITLSVTGGGSFNLNFGGTQAQTKVLPAAATLPGSTLAGADGSTGSPPAVGSNNSGGGAFVPGDASADLTTVFNPTGGGTGNGNGNRQAAPAASTKDDKDHALLLALVVLALGALLIQGDLARMRRVDRRTGGVS